MPNQQRSIAYDIPSPTQSTLTQSSLFTQSTMESRHSNQRPSSPTESVTTTATTISVSWMERIKRFISGNTISDTEYDSDSESTVSTQRSKRSSHKYAASISGTETNESDKIRLRLIGGRSCTSVLRAEGIPKYLSAKNGKYKWYRITSNGDMLRIEGQNDSIFHPHLDDIGHKITCQWIPYGAGYLDNSSKKLRISNFAQLGPMLMCSKLEKQCNELLQSTNHIQFRVSIPQCSSFPHIITIKRNCITVAPDTNGIHAMSQNVDHFDHTDLHHHQASFEITLNENTKIVFSDAYSSQFSIVDNEGNEFAQIIAKDHIQRQLIGLVIRKNMEQFSKHASPKNKYYWQFKVQQLTERNIVLQREMNEIRHKNESIMPIIESLSKHHDHQQASEYEILSATERERELYQSCRDLKEKLRIQTNQISGLTSERELLKQNFRSKSRHMKQAQKRLNESKIAKNKISEMLKNLREKDIFLTDSAEKLEVENQKLSEENIVLSAKLETTTRQKEEAFGILRSDFSSAYANEHDKQMWSSLNKTELIEKIRDLQIELANERGMRKQQMDNNEHNMEQLQQIKIEYSQLRDRVNDKYEIGNASGTLTWEQSAVTNSGSQQHQGQIANHPQVQVLSNSLNQAQTQQKNAPYNKRMEIKRHEHQSKIYHRHPLMKHESSQLGRPTFTKKTKSFHSDSRSVGRNASSLHSNRGRNTLQNVHGSKLTDTFKQLMAPDTNTFDKISADCVELTVDGVYQWAKSHRLIHLRNIANTLREHSIDGAKLKQLNNTDGVIKLNVFGVPSRHVSDTLRAINALFHER